MTSCISGSGAIAGKSLKAPPTTPNFHTEQILRMTLLELLYARRRTEPRQPSLSLLDAEAMTGRPREHLEFSIWFLTQKKLVQRGDDAAIAITADGVEYLESISTTKPGAGSCALKND